MAPKVNTNGGISQLGLDEQELVRRLRANDAAAYEYVVRTFGGRMLAVARRLLANEADAADAVQDAFLSAFRSLDRFEGNSQLATWLHRIVVNASLLKLRSRRKSRETPIEGLLPRFLEDGHPVEAPAAWDEAVEAGAQRREMQALIRELIDSLPENYRTVLLLRDIEELSGQETAELLGIEPNAVKVRLHRARQALRTRLDRRLRGEHP